MPAPLQTLKKRITPLLVLIPLLSFVSSEPALGQIGETGATGAVSATGPLSLIVAPRSILLFGSTTSDPKGKGNVTFKTPFTIPPVVVITGFVSGHNLKSPVHISLVNVTPTGFSYEANRHYQTNTNWTAIGQ